MSCAWSDSESRGALVAPRRQTRQVLVGSVAIGADAPVTVQSMTNTDTRDAEATLAQITRLADVGCEIVRIAIPHADALDGFERICAQSPLPVIADIHFDHRLAIEAAHRGAAKLRINPGNIGATERVDAVIDAAGEAGIPIRIGVNAGSLADEYHDKDWPLAEKLVASAVAFCTHFEHRGFTDIVVSAKASSVNATIDAYRALADALPYPLHIGVTEAGTSFSGTVKSSVGLGALLSDGIGDTLRVSLTADPVEEVRVGWEILAALDIRRRGPELISCPTCGRCQVDLVPIAQEIERRLRSIKTPVKVAVMGCIVNGPGEARDADIGVAAGKGVGLIFRKGEPVRKVAENDIVSALMDEIASLQRP
ncbi:MAG: flavodoxin-dependent (E)-4-hydroxy-3-methylbut-2-enyl-diphosphate synthase [Coriobacteriia bacterium]|nr:flavodoxin-dependent (E)-4-hydroxy-3-methylbut-2-enyl-diphosphate synthase [Coriobacteriia bacterium]